MTPAQKAWETRRRRAAGEAPKATPKPQPAPRPDGQLSAAQKAWETRRLRDAARADQQAREVLAAAPVPVPVEPVPAKESVVELLNAMGSGYRRFIVINVGPRTVSLFHAPTLATIEFDRLTFDRTAKPAPRVKPHILRDIIKRNMRTYDRLMLDYNAKNAELALTALGEKN